MARSGVKRSRADRVGVEGGGGLDGRTDGQTYLHSLEKRDACGWEEGREIPLFFFILHLALDFCEDCIEWRCFQPRYICVGEHLLKWLLGHSLRFT